jgi:hypothetical protein
MEGMATEAAWLNGNRLTGKRKRKCALTSTGLLMEVELSPTFQFPLLWSVPNRMMLLSRGNSRMRSSMVPSVVLLQRYRSMR